MHLVEIDPLIGEREFIQHPPVVYRSDQLNSPAPVDEKKKKSTNLEDSKQRWYLFRHKLHWLAQVCQEGLALKYR